MAALLDPLVEALTEKQDSRPGAIATAIGSRATGVQAGGLLAFLSSRVLGQYEIFGTGGRLLLVAPNIVATERKLGVDPSRLPAVGLPARGHPPAAVHRGAWLKAHLESEIAEFVDATDLDADVLRERLPDVLRSLADAVRGGDDEREGLMALIKDPAQRAVLDRVTAVMSLVEGHAEYVMDGVGPDVVPTVRDAAQAVRPAPQGPGPVDRVLRRLLGPRAEDEAVRRGPGLRRRRRRPRRHGGLQPRVGGPGEPAAHRGAHRAGALGGPGPRPPGHPGLSRRMAGPRPAVAQVRTAVRPGADRLDAAGARRLQRGSGLPRAGRRPRLRGPRAGVRAGG